jgi:uncharacterized membrane protein HdeD (DUF308 family)
MLIVLCAFILISFFEVRNHFKKKEKKEAVLFIIFGGLAVLLGVFMLLTPDFTSFANMMINLFGVKK